MKYLEILNQAEKTSNASLMWNRTKDNVIFISTVGYVMQEHMDLEKQLLKAGCKYDFSKPLQEFDRTNGRTITFFKTPLKPGKE